MNNDMDTSKLPKKWQEHIKAQDQRIRELEQALTEQDESRIYQQAGAGVSAPRTYLPDDVPIYVTLGTAGNGKIWGAEVRIILQGDTLQINGDDELVLTYTATNNVLIKQRRFREI